MCFCIGTCSLVFVIAIPPITVTLIVYCIELSVFELIMKSVNGKEGVAGPDRFGSEISLYWR